VLGAVLVQTRYQSGGEGSAVPDLEHGRRTLS
jgi:hypothetical protein